MRIFLSFFLLMFCLQLAKLQQCRPLSVCDEDQAGLGRREKGDIGSPGKAGPVGMKGAKGEIGIGEKGNKGEPCTLEPFETEIRRRLSELESNIARKLESVQPESCSTSSVQGRQRLSSGVDVFCDDRWTIFQKRNLDNALDFNQNWAMYKSGFGNLDEDFWLGLENIHVLTRSRSCRLRVDVWDSSNNHVHAIYSNFGIADESDKYRLRVSGYSGTAGDGLTGHSSPNGIHNNMKFSTNDNDNDRDGGNCASRHEGGWWFNVCWDSCLTCKQSSFYWDDARRQSSTMKFRCD